MQNCTMIINFFHKLALRFAAIFSIALMLCLTASTLFISYYAEDMTTQIPLFHPDNPLLSVPAVGILIWFFAILRKNSESTLCKLERALLLFTMIYILFCCAFLVIFGRSAPAADSMSVYSIAESFASGNMAAFQPTGNTYLSFYPQQIGLIGFYEIIIRIWNLLSISTPAYHIIKCINGLFACLIVFYQYRWVKLVSSHSLAGVAYLILSILNLPLIMYTSFVYGEIPSFAMISIGIYYLFRAIKQEKDGKKNILTLIVSLLSILFAVALRKNSLIIAIAVFLALLIQGLKERRRSYLAFAILLLLGAIQILPLIENLYEIRTGNTILSGVPAISYFAMGMQESERGNGWYNGFNFYTYQEQGLDTAATVAVSKDVIAERLAYFKEEPVYAVSFYINKFLSQWTDGTYACRQATLNTFAERLPFLQSIYQGYLSNIFATFCNIHQFIVFLGALLFLLLCRKKKEQCWALPLYIGYIGLIGGLLFHIIWEASSRYILAYGLLLIPYAAIGISTSKEDVR